MGGIMTPQLSVQLDSAVVWLRADSLTGADGSAITTWANEGTGADFTQATADLKPTLQTAEQNGVAVVRFDGVNDYLAGPALGFTGSYSIFTAIVARGMANAEYIFECGATGTSSINAYMWDNANANVTAGCRNADDLAYLEDNETCAFTADTAYRISLLFNSTTQLVTAQVNGTGTGTSATTLPNTAGTQVTNLAANRTPGGYGQLDICEFLAFGSALTAAQITLVNNYLSAKWGI